MGFSGIRAVILVVALIVLVLGVTKLGLPGWLLPVGLLLTAGAEPPVFRFRHLNKHGHHSQSRRGQGPSLIGSS